MDSIDDETKGKLIDGAVVAAKATALIGGQVLLAGVVSAISPSHGARHFFRVAIPRPINMWRNQRAKRAQREYKLAQRQQVLTKNENLRALVTEDGRFEYRGYDVYKSKSGNGWSYSLIEDPKWHELQIDSYIECMRQIDIILDGKADPRMWYNFNNEPNFGLSNSGE